VVAALADEQSGYSQLIINQFTRINHIASQAGCQG
jgi:hypothetical protein